MRKLFESTRRIEARGQFVGERLIVTKATGTGRADRLFVEAHRVNIAAVDSRNFGANQRGTILEVVRAIRCPDFELSVMCDQSLDILPSLVGRCRLAGCRLGECTVEVILCRLEC